MSTISNFPVTILNAVELPALQRLKSTLRGHFTRRYPTRLKELCPPAFAALCDTATLALPVLAEFGSLSSLVVYLPGDYAGMVESMVQERPRVRVHSDIGLCKQRAYFSWSNRAKDGNLPQTLWIQANQVQQAIKSNHLKTGEFALPLVMVADQTVAVGLMWQEEEHYYPTLDDIHFADSPPTGYSEAALLKAKQKALLYSECPWFFMRYDVKNEGCRLAVNLAPVCKMTPA